MGIIYALSSLGFAGINDLVFRKYGRKERPIGGFLAFVGLVWFLFFASAVFFKGSWSCDSSGLLVALVAGMFSAVANIFLIQGMKNTSASIASTIYRLNLVFVAILAFLVLKEPLNTPKLIGIAFAIVAVLFFSAKSRNSTDTAGSLLLLLLLASFLRACTGISYKFASSCNISDEIFLAVNGICWIGAGIAYSIFYEKENHISADIVRYGCISGILVCGIVFFLKMAVNMIDASVAVTISQFSFILTAPLAAIFLQEPLNGRKCMGIMCAVLCIVLFAVS